MRAGPFGGHLNLGEGEGMCGICFFLENEFFTKVMINAKTNIFLTPQGTKYSFLTHTQKQTIYS